jgi:uncharacterized surface protein with fasciclin (FAS1) repeats
LISNQGFTSFINDLRIMKKRFSFLAMIALLAGVSMSTAACSDDDEGIANPDAPAGTIVDVAVDGGFNTLVAAVQAADLVATLEGDGPFTVFAPTDEAFAKLPEGTVETLLKPENKDQLIAILTYHVVSGKVTSEHVVTLSKASTVEGSDLAISVEDGSVKVNDATVVAADVEASNGIIHVIDTVLLPPSE